MAMPEIAIALSNVTLLAGVQPALVDAIASEVEPIEVAGGDILFRRGDPGDSIYFVLSGRLRVFGSDQADGAAIAEIAAGESVGEMAALTGDPRSATVVAIRNCRLARLGRGSLDRLLRLHPELLGRISLLLARRLGQTGKAGYVRTAASCFTLLRASASIDLDAVAEKLGAALRQFAKMTVIDVRCLPPQLNVAGTNWQSQFADWANAIETQHEITLFVGSEHAPDWNAMCVRQADMVLLCCDAGEAPHLHGSGGDPIPPWSNVGLVVCQAGHPEGPKRTAAWLDAFRGAVHFNVRLSVAADFARLARLISGRGVGVVLSGGGARGVAHVGVVRALSAAGVAIDRVGGTSQGALVAAACAAGWDHEQILDMFRSFRGDNPTSDFTVPTVSLIAGRKAERALRRQFGERLIEDLPVDFFCVSASLTTGQTKVHRRGCLWEALRASISIPGIFPPFPLGGELLVDGGVLDNLPIGPLRARGAISVIASNVTPVRGLAARPAASPRRTWFRNKARRDDERQDHYRLPSIFQTLVHAGALNTISRLDTLRRAADLFIEPPVEGFRIFDWERVEEIAEIGYRHARQCLEAWAPNRPS